MPRPKSTAPAYRFHVSGQAFVRLDDRNHYLGKHGTPESYARYHALLAEYNANGLKMPDKTSTAEAVERLADTAILVKHVTADFRARLLPKYEHNNGSYTRLKNLLLMLEKYHGDDDVDTFGPRKLAELRDRLIATGNSRKYINGQVSDVIRIMRAGVSRELVPADVLVGLSSLDPLKRGEAKDNPKRAVVTIDVVSATLPELTPTLAAMVRIQAATAMRPSELFRLTAPMIDRTGEVWMK